MRKTRREIHGSLLVFVTLMLTAQSALADVRSEAAMYREVADRAKSGMAFANPVRPIICLLELRAEERPAQIDVIARDVAQLLAVVHRQPAGEE